ncbi:MAG: ribonuclease HII [Eubacteriales bacterium]|nr:ribonuclease HII [Eubacteriales bacterium]
MKENKENIKIKKLEIERDRLLRMSVYENEYKGKIIAGVDEAGRGPLAGDVYASCVILDTKKEILYLNDSKKLSQKKRELLYNEIKEKALMYGIGHASVEEIDKYNILNATYLAMERAIKICEENLQKKYNKKIDVLLNDAITIPNIDIKIQIPIIKGDQKSISIAAASVLAKVTRDKKCEEYDKLYPQYGFLKHKGYGTREHIQNLKKYKASPIHRKTFIKNFIN